MPYIKPERRISPEKRGYEAENTGELNYAITRLCDLFIADMGLNYATINAVVGALECAKQEFYRRIAAPHEDRKRVENGDVYTVVSAPPFHGQRSLPDPVEPKVYRDVDGDLWRPEGDRSGWRCWFARPDGGRFIVATDYPYAHRTLHEVADEFGPLTPVVE